MVKPLLDTYCLLLTTHESAQSAQGTRQQLYHHKAGQLSLTQAVTQVRMVTAFLTPVWKKPTIVYLLGHVHMIILLSPAKGMDFSSPLLTNSYTQPQWIEDAAQLVAQCQQLSLGEIQELMSISPGLAQLNLERFQNWQKDCALGPGRQAIQAFQGEAYEGLSAGDFSEPDLEYAQEHLRILSGLYGILRPLDLIQPYRLDMSTRLPTGAGPNLYHFWKDKLTGQLQEELSASPQPTLVNLASGEYFNVIQARQLGATIIQPIFLDQNKQGDYKIISAYAKRARGLMARFAIKNRLSHLEDLKQFKLNGYQFSPAQSSETQWRFTRAISQS
ncbi:UPF0246 protein [Bombiscardovia nodaiensis]|uniref:UPF0246 protein KIM372_08180 n=1 Tax=Bombiscardovia nodaiensis TaxID=2932181 RepID=A0ABM8B7R6_9BIFI|nr:UPF0246 protein [Bombiscardovia nodaiensis]